MAFSASDAAFEGFRLARRSPLTILIWALFYGLMTVVMFAIAGGAMGNFMELAQGMETGGEPSEAEVMAFMSAYFGFLGLILPVSLILGSVAYAAVNRAIVRPAESAFGYLRLGMDEVHVPAVSLLRRSHATNTSRVRKGDYASGYLDIVRHHLQQRRLHAPGAIDGR